jgi:hypothetical protein
MMPDVFAVTVAAISVVGGAVGRAPAAARRLPPGADNIRDLLVLDIAAVVTWALGIDPGGVSRGGGPAQFTVRRARGQRGCGRRQCASCTCPTQPQTVHTQLAWQ